VNTFEIAYLKQPNWQPAAASAAICFFISPANNSTQSHHVLANNWNGRGSSYAAWAKSSDTEWKKPGGQLLQSTYDMRAGSCSATRSTREEGTECGGSWHTWHCRGIQVQAIWMLLLIRLSRVRKVATALHRRLVTSYLGLSAKSSRSS